uniref:Immunoglobulin V-set domain-containing protein n=1 Tax=Naja naja TaxID=35670 RepID=A0A8C6VKV3_NAJNA
SILVWTLLLLFFFYSPGEIKPPSWLFSYSVLSSLIQFPIFESVIMTSSGFHFVYFTWYQQKEGESPRFILYYNTTSRETKFGPVASGHFSASTNTAKEIAFLTISNMQAKDEGDYYCGDNRHSDDPQRGD